MDSNSASWSLYAAVASAIAAACSAVAAFKQYSLSKAIQDELRSDDRLFFGKPSNPNLTFNTHSESVLQIAVFNKSRRKVVVSDLTVYDRNNSPIAASWGSIIDKHGNVTSTPGPVGFIDAGTLYVRRDDGRSFEYARILFSDSFSNKKHVVVFDPLAEFVAAR
jgi:hypothetical protein